MTNVGFKRQVATWLEQGALKGRWARLVARTWEKRSRPIRPVSLPPDTLVIGVGGATLGGAGKTPVVMQLSRELERYGASVAVVASSYRAQPPPGVRVLPHHRPTHVGDEALLLCRTLASIPVFVGRSRERALRLAARTADVVVVDGLLQTAPERLGLSILVLDGNKPWGSGACPPLGDLRARRDRLLKAADVLLVERSLDAVADVALPHLRWTFERKLTWVERPDGTRLPVHELQGKPLGLLTTIARPERLEQRLAGAGITIASRRAGADHGALKERRRPLGESPIEAWLTTAKCRQRLGQVFENIPVWVLHEEVLLPEQLVDLVLDKGVIRTRRAVLESAAC
jgi:tetraacyldisaccharide 4'-kinase